jgi:prefoldin subunit 4
MAEDLDEASNELIITDEESVRYGVGETFVMVENDEVGKRPFGGIPPRT